MSTLHSIRLAAPLGLAAALFSAPQGNAQVGVPVVQPAPAASPQPDAGFADYLQLVGARARGEGVRQVTIDAMTSGLTYNPKVVSLDRAQPGSNPNSPPAFWAYYRSHVDAARINGGRNALASNTAIIPGIEAKYGVPAKVLVAIWGHETFYGKVKGNFDLARSLATLAYDGRRRALFEGEFIALLKMADRGVPRSKMIGSWAGAFGNPQFLPSMYLRLARDGDGDGFADIWHSNADTLASIANYFDDAGWRTGEPWGVRVSAPAGLDRSLLTERLEAPSCPRVHARHSVWKTVGEWKALGISPRAAIADSTMAVLFEPDGPENGSFLLTGNYRVILHYNCSNYYALSVGLLADEISR
ncbi:MAG: lytic murein transglycosylase [Novosphingobium sp.]|uniref:lytic murein transglycosylase n=1 Tax=Novosphingobium sp. TaxID=1874826 RepID=UPI0032BCB284